MFDLAWSHILLIGVVALLVIGPKDLPRVLRTVGIWVGRARSVAREFQSSLDQMIREAELEEVRKQVETAATLDLDQTIGKAIDPGGELKQSLAETTIADAPAAAPAEPTLPAPPDTPVAPAEAALPAPEAEAAPEMPAAPPQAAPEEAPPPAKSGTHD
jgi:sec-independent protein translocase protein TatB